MVNSEFCDKCKNEISLEYLRLICKECLEKVRWVKTRIQTPPIDTWVMAYEIKFNIPDVCFWDGKQFRIKHSTKILKADYWMLLPEVPK